MDGRTDDGWIDAWPGIGDSTSLHLIELCLRSMDGWTAGHRRNCITAFDWTPGLRGHENEASLDAVRSGRRRSAACNATDDTMVDDTMVEDTMVDDMMDDTTGRQRSAACTRTWVSRRPDTSTSAAAPQTAGRRNKTRVNFSELRASFGRVWRCPSDRTF